MQNEKIGSGDVRRDPCEAPAPVSMADEVRRARLLLESRSLKLLSVVDKARHGSQADVTRCRPLVEQIADSVLRNPGAMISLVRLKHVEDPSNTRHAVALCGLLVALGRSSGLDRAGCLAAGWAGLFSGTGLDPVHEPDERPVDRALLERMSAICSAYDELTSYHTSLAGCDPALAIELMIESRGQFDRWLLARFVSIVGFYPVGSLVRLGSGRIAVVMEHRSEPSLRQQVVRVFHSVVARRPVPWEVVDLGRDDAGDRIVGREPRSAWAVDRLDVLWLP